MEIITTAKGKPDKVVDGDVEYVCIPVSQLVRVGSDFRNTLSQNPERKHFLSGYRFALERLGLQYFDEVPEIPPTEVVDKPRTKIVIGHNEYFEDEVLDRLSHLPTTKSIWRK